MVASPPGPVCYACITHVPVAITYPDFVKPICLGEAQTPGRLNLRDLAPRWEPYHRYHLGGSAGTFALRRYILEHEPDAKVVGLCTYRKFLTQRRIAAPEINGLPYDTIAPNDIDVGVMADAMMPGKDGFLFVKPARFMRNGEASDYLTQYEEHLKVQDLLRMTAMAVELGVLDSKEVIPFFHEKIFFIGGVDLGVFPTSFWLPTVEAMERVTWACVQQYDTVREGKDLRFWSMCLERLGSYLLLKYLRTGFGSFDWVETCTGYINVVSETGVYVPNFGHGAT
jgi:hypothetical protein